LVKGGLALLVVTAGLYAAHLRDEGLELSRAAEALPSEGKLVFLGHDIHLQFYVSLGVGQQCSVTEALDTVPLIPLRTLTLAVSQILIDLPASLTPLCWTSTWNVPAVTLDTRAVFLIFLILTAATILGVWACGPISVALESPDSTPGTVVTFGLVAIARKSFAGESVFVVANSRTTHF